MSGNGNDRRDRGDDRRLDDERSNGIDDGRSVLSGPPGRQLTTAQKLGIALLILMVFLAFIWIGQLRRTPTQPKTPEVSVTGDGGYRPAPIVLPPALPVPATVPLPAPKAASLPTPRHEMTPAESPIFAFSGGSEGAGTGPVARALGAEHVPPQAPAPAPPAVDNALSGRLKPTVLAGAKATLLPHPDMLLTEGTIIPCTLQTAINSELPGYVKCLLPDDVRSTTGNVVLLDRGTIVVGEVRDGLTQGQDRLFVLWDRAETPDHAIIQLGSPVTDELGRAGVTGTVNNHFWERFGGAILLSVVQGSLQAGTALAGNSGGGSGTYFNSFQSNGSEVSNTALQATINIPPTLEKNQGDNVNIFVSRDLDFSDIYNLRVSAGYGR